MKITIKYDQFGSDKKADTVLNDIDSYDINKYWFRVVSKKAKEKILFDVSMIDEIRIEEVEL